LEYTHGIGLDLGCGHEKINPATAIGIDAGGNAANINIDLSKPDALKIFSDEYFDYVFSSHLLEDFYDTETALREWWRVIKPGGHLILYLPHKYFYPDFKDDPGVNPNHKHNFIPTDIIKHMDKFATYNLVKNDSYNEKDEYSFEMVFEKTVYPVKVEAKITTAPKAIVFRWGAVGDLLQITPLLSVLKKHGYEVTLNCASDTKFVLENNPNIDKFILQERDAVPNWEIGNYMEYVGKNYQKSINLCESIEGRLLYLPQNNKFYKSKEDRAHDINYFDETLKIGGFDEKGLNPEMYLSEAEEFMFNIFRKRNEKFFKILWALKGSANHKLFAQAQDIMQAIVDKYQDARIYVVSGEDANPMEFKYERIFCMSKVWKQRISCLATKYVNLVVSPETGILTASGCFDTPKIGLLSHSNKENLTKYFKNDYSIQSKAPCSPCHRMYHGAECDLDKDWNLPLCTTMFDQNEIMATVDKLHKEWYDISGK